MKSTQTYTHLLDVSTEAGFSIATALRGPDKFKPMRNIVKYITVSVIRGIVLPKKALHKVLFNCVSEYEARQAIYSLSPHTWKSIRDFLLDESHFWGHVADALKYLNPEYLEWLKEKFKI